MRAAGIRPSASAQASAYSASVGTATKRGEEAASSAARRLRSAYDLTASGAGSGTAVCGARTWLAPQRRRRPAQASSQPADGSATARRDGR